ncbi:hypothetical protein BP6252_11629 [Coleophoma cylindrospora]|uniref:PNPLA domain-containing protein n=1 Tax=Coleophoma cylindrospora TaxID=1849047 RepID=A0A3D8QK44_9HELO|nr:hypothetical protein BP6252_11629 [Coleophoma cylindrospora]
MTSDKPLCLLALDGGGIRGLSELIVLEEIMNRIKFDCDEDKDLLPADFFDLIGGTSTGGLIALLLGRLRLSVPQARREYVRIAEQVFSRPSLSPNKNAFDSQKLEKAIKELLGNDRSEEKMLQKDGGCKVFVCAVPQQDVKARTGPRLFRTYKVRENASFNCTIWEACRATSAAPAYFAPIKIGHEGEQETFVDGGLGYNNPIEQVLEEARRVFPRRKVACVVSIGTGVARVIEFPNSPKTSPIKLINALKEMATESDTTAEKVHKRFQNVKDTYFRFSVDRGLQGVGLEEWKELPKVRTYTTDYLVGQKLSEQVDQVVQALLASKIVDQQGSASVIQLPQFVPGEVKRSSQETPRMLEWRPAEGGLPNFPYTTEQLASHIVVSLSRVHFKVPLGLDEAFVGRERILQQLVERVPPNANECDCQRTAIEGLGGVGKTQIALQIVYKLRDAHPDCSVFWVPAVNMITFENAYRDIGRALETPGIEDDKADIKTLVKTALEKTSSSWVLVIDNADDPDLLFGDTDGPHVCDFLPFSLKGSILFTTRNHDAAVQRLGISPKHIYTIHELTEVEAFRMLQKSVDENKIQDVESTKQLLSLLTCLPLAIKQASAYMASVGESTTEYLKHWHSSDKYRIRLLSKDFGDIKRYKGLGRDVTNAIATTWLISFDHITKHHPLAAQYLKFICFLAEKDIPLSLLPPQQDEWEKDEAVGRGTDSIYY